MTAQSLYHIAINGSTIKGLTQAPTLNRRQQRAVRSSSGALHVTAGHIIRTAPRVDFSTHALGQILTLLTGSPEAPMLALDGTTGLTAIAPQNAVAAPGWLTGTTATQWRMANGEAYLNRISWNNSDPDVTCDLSVFGISTNGVTDAVAETTGATAPANAQDDESWTLTGCSLNGVDLNPESVAITIDARAENTAAECYSTGLIHPTAVTKAGAAGPVHIMAEIETLLVQATLATGPLVLTFTQRAEGGLLTATTRTLTLLGGMIGDDGLSSQPLSRKIVYEARHDGANRPLTIA